MGLDKWIPNATPKYRMDSTSGFNNRIENGVITKKRTNTQAEKSFNSHPTVKPIKLMAYLISLGSRPNDLILDPFCGSGTTGIACNMLKRRFIGVEINEEYSKIAKARLNHPVSPLIHSS